MSQQILIFFVNKHLKMAERLFDDLSAEEIKKKKQITLYLLRIKKNWKVSQDGQNCKYD